MGIVLGYVFGERPHDPKVGKGSQAIKRQENGPNPKSRAPHVSEKKWREKEWYRGEDDEPQRTEYRIPDDFGPNLAFFRRGRLQSCTKSHRNVVYGSARVRCSSCNHELPDTFT